MPELPHVSGAQARRALERLGPEFVRQRGSHMVFRRGAVGCVVPNHGALKLGTLAAVIKQAGVSVEEFLCALRG